MNFCRTNTEKMPSDETDDRTINSSGTDNDDDDENDGKCTIELDGLIYNVLTTIESADIRIVTKEVYDGSTRNWTNRAGSFLEQSRAFFDSYLGRWDRNIQTAINDEDIEDSVPENGEECTSGATSGEEVWGTPTSGENDEIQMFNSDQTVSSEHMITF